MILKKICRILIRNRMGFCTAFGNYHYLLVCIPDWITFSCTRTIWRYAIFGLDHVWFDSVVLFSDGINSVTSVFLEYSYLVKKVVFDINILPVIKIISAMFVHIFFIFLIFIVMALFGYMPSICYIQAFYYSFCMICLILAIGYFYIKFIRFFSEIYHNLYKYVYQQECG